MSRRRIIVLIVLVLIAAIGWYLSGAIIVQDRSGRVTAMTLMGDDNSEMTSLPGGFFIGRPGSMAVLRITCRNREQLDGEYLTAPSWHFLARRTCYSGKKRY